MKKWMYDLVIASKLKGYSNDYYYSSKETAMNALNYVKGIYKDRGLDIIQKRPSEFMVFKNNGDYVYVKLRRRILDGSNKTIEIL